jgi:hypothetical protein
MLPTRQSTYCGTFAGCGHCKKHPTMFFAHQKVYERNLPPRPTQLTRVLIRRRATPPSTVLPATSTLVSSPCERTINYPF